MSFECEVHSDVIARTSVRFYRRMQGHAAAILNTPCTGRKEESTGGSAQGQRFADKEFKHRNRFRGVVRQQPHTFFRGLLERKRKT